MKSKNLINPMEKEVREKFEDILRKHTRRLVGLNHELNNILMTLDFLTLTSTVLLVEREKEIRANFCQPSDRYTESTLLEDLADLGLDDNRKLKIIIQTMIQKQYIIITSDDKLMPTESSFQLTDLYDSIFPNMPGLSLVTYFNQISDEILSNRKDMELAVAQLTKTLRTQGVSLIKPAGKSSPKKKIQKKKSPLQANLAKKTNSRISKILNIKKAGKKNGPVQKNQVPASSKILKIKNP